MTSNSNSKPEVPASMIALCRPSANQIVLRSDLPTPSIRTPSSVSVSPPVSSSSSSSSLPVVRLLVQVAYAAINQGDVRWIAGGFANTFKLTGSLFDVAGVSACGQVIDVEVTHNVNSKEASSASSSSTTTEAESIRSQYLGRWVSVYRGLVNDECVGTWCTYASLLASQCVLLPTSLFSPSVDDSTRLLHARSFSGTLVNAITPLACLNEMNDDDARVANPNDMSSEHRADDGVLITAASSMTGKAMLALCGARGIHCVALVRSLEAKQTLQQLQREAGLDHADLYQIIVVEAAELAKSNEPPSFISELQQAIQTHRVRRVFDSVGGSLLTSVLPLLPVLSVVYIYGALDRSPSAAPLSVPTALFLTKRLAIKGFANFMTGTVMDKKRLKGALEELALVIDKYPKHFETPVGQVFTPQQFGEALAFKGKGKAIFDFTQQQ